VSSKRHQAKKEGLPISGNPLHLKAGLTRLELATSDVTGRRSNQLNYSPARKTGDEPAVTMAHPDDCAACSEKRWWATIAR
jgi:hypothetical protein